MQPDTAPNVSTAQEPYVHNHKKLMEVLQGGETTKAEQLSMRPLGITIERVLYDHATKSMVGFGGKLGIEAVLAQIARQLHGCVEEWHDGHLMGFSSPRGEHSTQCKLVVTLGPGGQIVCTVGPSCSVVEMLEAIDGFDREVHVASRALGCDYELLAEGYNSFVDSPLDVPLIPRTRWTLVSAHLSQTGRYARDAMRCSCATHITLGYESEREALATYRLCVALTPLLMFLTDNVRSFRGSGARRCPVMTRSIVWNEVDPARCGIVPGTFETGFSFERYVDWLEGLMPILATTENDEVSSTGKRTLRELMSERDLTSPEILDAFGMALPFVRLGTTIQILQVDALRPRMAASLCAFAKGLLRNDLNADAAITLLGDLNEDAVLDAIYELRLRGWNAIVYGRRVDDLVQRLVAIARSGINDPRELRLLDELAELWDFNMVPRDAFVHQEVKQNRGW
ncbi:MAG: glutamate-cysteine ligase family protein [Coriobacteriales bacterium]|nr:glutamate-cysteine ligase family protein [Coriobacteriales bacterium]